MTGGGGPGSIFARPSPRLYSIAPEHPFLTDLARTLRASIAAAGAELSGALIYLPTRRAVRALADAFVATAPDARASLLPRIRALGDIDEDEFTVFEGATADEIDLPPAVSSMERRLTLARLVAARDRAFDGQERWAGALAAADELGRLLDSFYTEEISPAALETLVPDALAEHWRRSLAFLEIVTSAWPAHLAERGLMDPAERRVRLIDRQRQHWETAPPAHPVVIAGTTGSAPAVARLMKTAAALPLGAVVLPGLDLLSSARFWETIDAPHPQSGLKQLLSELDATRADVAPWPDGGDARSSARSEIISVALCPANASDSWRDWAIAIEKDRGRLEDALSNATLIEAADEEREATAIALKIREALETPGKTIILATPDRSLARRVAARMRRWDVIVDDSAGVPFANSPCGTYLRLLARWLVDPSNAVALMALLRHPLFGGGLDDKSRKSAADAMDRAMRGLRPRPDGGGLRAKLDAAEDEREKAAPLMKTLELARTRWPSGGVFAERFAAHLEIAEMLAATTDSSSGADRLWGGEDGDAGAAALAPLRAAVEGIVHDQPANYPDIVDQLIAGVVVRRTAPAHPRIAILGPLEARLQHADLVILGGLNEGVWPREAAIDPFLSRPMRAGLKLPSPEQRIGLSAHDFAQLAAAPEVMLTRAERAGGKPTKPSRWIVRLKNILKGANAVALIDRTHEFDILARRLDAPQNPIKLPAPRPAPPVDARPDKFFVTRIEKLMRDPYAVYARQILGLEKLDELNEPLSVRHIGNLFHRILQDYASEDLPASDTMRAGRLRGLFHVHAAAYGLDETHMPFWRARADEAFGWLAGWDADRRRKGAPAIVEGKGLWSFEVGGRAFTLGAKSDRIDLLNDGSIFIIDYKTGAPPTMKQAQTFSPQLPLTGLIALKGGFETLGAVSVSGFEYLRVIGRKDKKEDTSGAYGDACGEMIGEAEAGLYELLRHFNDPATPYPSQPRPQYADDYGDYDRLARRRERNAQGGDE